MVAIRLFTLLLLAASIAMPARADVFPYEAVGVGGRNNMVDSNASSCDSTEGCYNRTGARCSLNPNTLCDLQIVPAGRCTSGDLTTGLASKVWPHGAGHCSGNTKVGCLTDGYCTDAGGTCSLTTDPFGAPYQATANTCQGTAPGTPATFETAVCGGLYPLCSDGDVNRDVGGFGTALGTEILTGAVGSQSYAGLGPAINGIAGPKGSPRYGIENPAALFDPQRNAGSLGRTPTGAIHQVRGTDARQIDDFLPAVELRKATVFGDSAWVDWFAISVVISGLYNTHIVTFTCDPFEGWQTQNSSVSGAPLAENTTMCSRVGRNSYSFLWNRDLTPTEVATYTVAGQRVCPPNCNKDFNISTTELQELNEAGLQTPAAGVQLALQSGDEAVGRQAGARDAIGVAAITSITWLVDNDLRCNMGGWGNGALIGRCSDGANPCDPRASAPDQATACSGQGGSCRACNGPLGSLSAVAGVSPNDPALAACADPNVMSGACFARNLPNTLGLPIGYNTHGFPELDLKAGERIGGIAGQGGDIRVPLFVVGSTGYAASDFRDIASEGLPAVDLADLGSVDPAGLPFASGIGTGGSFPNGTPLNIGEPCCNGGVPVPWDAEALGEVTALGAGAFTYRWGAGGGDTTVSDWALTYDLGPGPDGIPGCIGDNEGQSNGALACNQRLGVGVDGPKTNGFYATGQDDRAIRYSLGGTLIPASASRFQWRDADAATVAHFGGSQNPPTVNTVAAFTVRDIKLFALRSTDILVKNNTTQCPIVGSSGPVCTPAAPPIDPCIGNGDDVDGDTICGNVDNCPTVANTNQLDSDLDTVGNVCDNCPTTTNEDQLDGDGDLDGNVCDNCVTVANADQADTDADGAGQLCDSCTTFSNPREISTYLASNQWATLTGQQRDDDHDGFGNKCDGKFPGVTGAFVGTNDLTQFRASNTKNRTGDTCGTILSRPCAIYDLDQTGTFIGSGDLTQFRLLNTKSPGPKCAACTGTGSVPLPCTAGTAGGC